MASTSVNDSKRNEMKVLMASIKPFAPTKVVAALMGVSESTVNSWAAGKSMGTNAQRFYLADHCSSVTLRRAAVNRLDELLVQRTGLTAAMVEDVKSTQERLAFVMAPAYETNGDWISPDDGEVCYSSGDLDCSRSNAQGEAEAVQPRFMKSVEANCAQDKVLREFLNT